VNRAGELVELLAKLYPMSAEARAAVLQETVPLPQPPSADAQLAHHAEHNSFVGRGLASFLAIYYGKAKR
jgi:hypothetical protein